MQKYIIRERNNIIKTCESIKLKKQRKSQINTHKWWLEIEIEKTWRSDSSQFASQSNIWSLPIGSCRLGNFIVNITT